MGAPDFSFDIDTGWGTLVPEAERPLDLEALDQAVQQAGFELLELELRLRGALSSVPDPEGGERPAVTIAASGQRFLLHAGATDDERDVFARLEAELGDSPRAVEVYGRAHGGAGLSVQDFQWLE